MTTITNFSVKRGSGSIVLKRTPYETWDPPVSYYPVANQHRHQIYVTLSPCVIDDKETIEGAGQIVSTPDDGENMAFAAYRS
jgi:hypothetical protein